MKYHFCLSRDYLLHLEVTDLPTHTFYPDWDALRFTWNCDLCDKGIDDSLPAQRDELASLLARETTGAPFIAVYGHKRGSNVMTFAFKLPDVSDMIRLLELNFGPLPEEVAKKIERARAKLHRCTRP